MTATAQRNGQYSFLHALDAIDRGMCVFPVGDKKPLVEGGFYAATEDPDQIKEWAETWPRAGIAIPTGQPSGIMVIDADGPEQVDQLTRLFGRGPDVRTRRGAHWYFRHPRRGKVTSGPIGDGVDRKGDGGYVELPPSPGKTWSTGDMPDLDGLPVLPVQIAAARIMGTTSRNRDGDVAGDVILEGQRNPVLTSLAGTVRDRGGTEAEIYAFISRVNADRCEPQLDDEEVRGIARSVAQYEPKNAPKKVTDPNWTPGLGARSPIVEAMTRGVEPPEQLREGILYAGMIHSLHGLPGAGKTLLAVWMALQAIRQGKPVLYLDQENGFRTQAERLKALGATPEEIDKLFHHYSSPVVTLEEDHLEDLRATFDEICPALVVFDSWADFLALAGLDENSSTDVTGWVLKVCQPLKGAGAAAVILDHVTKDGGGYGRRGSGAKLAKLDAAFKLTKEQDFDRGRVGLVKLGRDKDREACLYRRVAFEIGGDGNGRLICRPDTDVSVDIEVRLNDSQQAAMDALNAKPHGEGITRATWLKTSGLPETTFDRARRYLVAQGHAEQVEATGRYRPTDPADQLPGM